MYLENIVFDAVDPRALGRFWESALGTERLTDVPEGFETRLAVPDGPVLDLCFQPVPGPATAPQRLHLDLRGAAEQETAVERLLGLGASRSQSGPAGMLTDPEGNRFGVVPAGDADSGPITAVTLDVGDPDRELAFWAWLTGWVPAEGHTLRHASGRGPLLELRPEPEPKGPAKNRIHLDARLEPGDDADAVAAAITERGGRELHPDWGDLPWRVFADPSGNEFCVLAAYTVSTATS